jgi:hypothetical protein
MSAERPRKLWSNCAFAGPISTEVTFANKLRLISIWSRKEMSRLSVPCPRLSWVAAALSRFFFFVSSYSLRIEAAQRFSQDLFPLRRYLTVGSTRDPGWRGQREYQRFLSRICVWRHPYASYESDVGIKDNVENIFVRSVRCVRCGLVSAYPNRTVWTAPRNRTSGLFGGMSVFARRIKQML